MVSIEIAHKIGWRYLWLETDSMLVYMAFKSHKIVPWQLQNRWDNCLHLCASMRFYVSHILREGNKCADTLANTSLSIPSHCWFSHIPANIWADLVNNKLGLPSFRVS